MKKVGVALAMAMILLVAGNVNAALWDRGGGLIYDDVLDITWLQDANYAQTSGYDSDGRMDWDAAMAWADGLVYGGYDDWRLPDAHNQDGSGPIAEYQQSGSEMGHMFYNNLGGDDASFPGSDFVDGNGINTSFLNLQSSWYWYRTEYEPNVVGAWDYFFHDGYQSIDLKEIYNFAWAVRPGDISSVPIPSAVWLLGSGLVGLVGFRRKFKKA